LDVLAAARRAVVVDDGFVGLRIAFARHVDLGAGVFEHRGEVLEDEREREYVLNGLEQAGALPFAAVERRIVIQAMAGPERDVAPVESGAWSVGPIRI